MPTDGHQRPVDILLVEDNPGDARLAAEALKESAFSNRLHWAADGAQAMEFLRRPGQGNGTPRPDLILLDLNLPGKDGRELLAELKQDPALRQIPVIVLTSSQAAEDRRRSYDLQANCYITKPINFDGLSSIIRSIGEFWFSHVDLPGQEPPAGSDGSGPAANAAPWAPRIAPQPAGPGAATRPTDAADLVLPRPAAGTRPAGPVRVLLVEDNPADARFVLELLTDAGKGGLGVAHAGTVREGLRLLAQEDFDAILLDLSLPDSQGIDTLTALHAQATGVPILVLTGLEDEAVATRALRHGAQDYLVKGKFEGDLLVRAMDHAIERMRSGRYLHYMAHHDGLTGLPNRTLLQDRLDQALERARRNRETVALLFLDLDHFKKINDALGHAAGDELLQQVAARLRACVRASDTVARAAGDEFTVLLPEIARLEDVATVAEKIMIAFQTPFRIGEHELRVSASLGASLYPNDGLDVETLLKNADAAMYRAKEQGRANYQLYSAAGAPDPDREVLARGLKGALERQELLLHYQPTVDAVSGTIVALEALVRWQRPEGGLVLPGRFLPLAEATGNIIEIGDWVLRSACAQGFAWQHAGLQPLRVGVNLSFRQLHQGRALVETVARVLQETGFDPQRLELEVTEEAVMKDEATALRTLRALHDMGIRITVDDFGTGYASLSLLKCFPFCGVKIDRTFIRDVTVNPDDAAIVASITAMGHSLRMNVVAEGVESTEQVSFLLRHQIDQMQGPYFSTPVSAEACAELIRTGPAGLVFGGRPASGNGHGPGTRDDN